MFTIRQKTLTALVDLLSATQCFDDTSSEDLFLLVSGILSFLPNQNCPSQNTHNSVEAWKNKSPVAMYVSLGLKGYNFVFSLICTFTRTMQ